ncbi:MAG: thymidine phosphorylase [Oscillospiraceae bacterium]|nr:thymidine phosphorylase [Oscillospiraceae bacterium]
MDMRTLIRKKRCGDSLSHAEIEWIVNGAAYESIPEEQLAAFLMAVMFKGLSHDETLWMALGMAKSGEQMDLSSLPGVSGDKHSTGGVGDKTTLIVAPLAAACGLFIAKMAGRGLGHTGGTIDKLESVPGMRTSFDGNEFLSIVRTAGLCIAAQSTRLTPADKKLYALRDFTDTTDSIPLIAASVMSKKLATGADCILLDVKFGSGAFMKTPEQAEALADIMVNIGKLAGRECAALITDMNQPLGKSVGNALELREAVEVLSGQGSEDLTELCLRMTAELLRLAACRSPRKFPGSTEARLLLAREKLNDGTALKFFCKMIEAQGGSPGHLFEKTKHSPFGTMRAGRGGYISSMDTMQIGQASMCLGAGRAVKNAPVDPLAGIVFLAKTGDKVSENSVIAELHTSSVEQCDLALELLSNSIVIEDIPPHSVQLIRKIIY